jgi:hypothetical protein
MMLPLPVGMVKGSAFPQPLVRFYDSPHGLLKR